jgi:hypothetical protein
VHRPVLQQRQDRSADVAATRPSPAAATTAPPTEGAATERTATEGRTELPEGAAPLEVAPTLMTGPAVPMSVPMLVLVSM